MKITKNNYVYYTALFVWAVFSIGVIGYFYGRVERSVFPLFYNVGSAWNSGESMYAGVCRSYSYWPGFSLIFAFLAKFPYGVGSAIWTGLNVGSIFGGIVLLGRSMFGNEDNKVGLFLLLGLPLLIEGMFNQQSNAIVAGISLMGAACIYRERYLLGSVLLLFSGISKVAPIAFAMLFLVMYPWKLWWRYLLALVILFTIPVLFSGYDYFVGQHREWVGFLTHETNERWEYRDFFVLYELVFKGKMTTHLMPDFPAWYRGVQLFGAGLLCAVCMWFRYVKRYNTRSILAVVVMSGSVWWLLFGPSTEIATCVAGVGVSGLGVVLARSSRVGWWLMLPAYILVALGSSGDVEWNLEQLTTSDWIYGLLPIGATLMYVWICLFSQKALALTTEDKEV